MCVRIVVFCGCYYSDPDRCALNDEVVMRSLPTQVLEKQSEMLNGVRQGKEKCHHGREEHVVVRSARSFAEKSTVT
jgi:hypothetical protein